MTTEFDYTIDRDGQSIELFVTAEGSVEPKDTEVGYMSDGITLEGIDAVDAASGNAITLFDYERRAIKDEASQRLNDEFRDRSFCGYN